MNRHDRIMDKHTVVVLDEIISRLDEELADWNPNSEGCSILWALLDVLKYVRVKFFVIEDFLIEDMERSEHDDN